MRSGKESIRWTNWERCSGNNIYSKSCNAWKEWIKTGYPTGTVV